MKLILLLFILLGAACSKDISDPRKPDLFVTEAKTIGDHVLLTYSSTFPYLITEAEFHITSPVPSVYIVGRKDFGSIDIPISHFTGNFRLVTEQGIIWTEKFVY